ncbi:MAG: PD-(D/E)XK nuclease family protein, partial [Carboxylicivirga sp.]|nr:PD-(D/E)XK nuclease family protein [Carboxylicivirga sp.]
LKNVSHLLFRLINQFNMVSGIDKGLQELLVEGWDEENQCFELGNIPAQKAKETTQATTSEQFKTQELGSRIRIHPESAAMSSPDSFKNLKHGKIMHRLFELIVDINDVESAITRLILNGQLKTSEKEGVQEFVLSKIKQEGVEEWFKTDNKIINEGTIMVPTGTYRPDRVIIQPDKVIVVDYKFGELHQEKYKQQVKRYMDLLKQMGYQNIDGYLWYLRDKDEIVKIGDEPIQGSLF